MRGSALLQSLQNMGLTLRVEGGNLIVFPKAAITDQTRVLIRNHKAELLAQLAANDPIPSVDVSEQIEEACSGLPITPAKLRGHLSAEDLDDVGFGDLTTESLRAYAEFCASEKGYLCR